jgi:hypothetical protein
VTEKAAEMAERLRKPFSGRMTEEQVEFLRDAQAAIEFAIRNGLSFATIVTALGHDLNEITHEAYDLQRAKSRGFVPKVAGYSKLSPDDFGVPEGPLD